MNLQKIHWYSAEELTILLILNPETGYSAYIFFGVVIEKFCDVSLMILYFGSI
jgi:hypothetical protein